MQKTESKMKGRDFFKEKAKELLDEHAEIRSPGTKAKQWIIKAQTLLIFAEINRINQQSSGT